MKHNLSLLLTLLLLLCVVDEVLSAESPYPRRAVYMDIGELHEPHLTLGMLTDKQDALLLTGRWLYHPGDNPAWADPDFADSDWEVVDPLSKWYGEIDSSWTGIGWFRFHLTVDTTLLDQPIALEVLHTGAIEVYMNRLKVFTHGRVSANPDEEIYAHSLMLRMASTICRDTSIVVAVRLSNHQIEMQRRLESPHFFSVAVAEAQRGFQSVRYQDALINTLQVTFTAISMLMAIMHVLIYAFNHHDRKDKHNLYFAVYAFFCALLAWVPFEQYSSGNINEFLLSHTIFNIVLVGVGLTGLKFLYALFGRKMTVQYWVLVAAGGILTLLSWRIPTNYLFLFVSLTSLESIRVIYTALRRKQDGSWIVALGFASFFVLTSYQMLEASGITGPVTVMYRFPYLFGIAFMLAAVSLLLARSIAKTNLRLAEQLVKVHKLSEKTLAQERKAQEEALQRSLLEQEVEHKAKQLEEAQKLAQALAELEKTHEQLKRTQSQLVQSEKMASMGMLVAGVAHEINTPVGAIASMHNTLKRAIERIREYLAKNHLDLDPELEKPLHVVADATGVIDSGCKRVTTIVRRLKSFARLDEAQLKRADLREGLEDTLLMAHHELKHAIEVVRNYGQIPDIACYPSQLNQVFLNLIMNAKQAIHGSGTITITTGLSDGWVTVSIADTGEGIPKERLGKIFDPGFTTKGVGVGTGLGLAICYQIIEDHYGRIEVESEIGRGTTFTLYLPLNLEEILDKEVDESDPDITSADPEQD